jgi:hypothetical protein
MRCVVYVALVVETPGACMFLVGKPEKKRPLGRGCRRCEVNIKTDPQEIKLAVN